MRREPEKHFEHCYRKSKPMKKVLIEDWLPIQELGIESRRERAAVHALPPLSFLHTWWARRPIVASTGVILTSMLPSWDVELAQYFSEHAELASPENYKKWVMQLCGIWGDPITARKLIDAAELTGTRLQGNVYGYKQAYRNLPLDHDLLLLDKVLVKTWGENPVLLDPTAGGGSIPFSSARLGIKTIANDLNGVAAAILTAGVEIPSRSGNELADRVEYWGTKLVNNINQEIAQFFPKINGESITAYIWANAVICPRSGRLVPLMPDKWLQKESGKEAAVKIVTKDKQGKDLSTPTFEIITGTKIDKTDADKGTIKRGEGISPYDNLVIDGDYVKNEAQEQRMTQILYAIATKDNAGNRSFRAPSASDLEAIDSANEFINQNFDEWIKLGYLPSEDISKGQETAPPLRYGNSKWSDMFLKRQLIVHGTFVKKFSEMIKELKVAETELADDILVELAIMQGKSLNYNAKSSRWELQRQKIVTVFERHDLSFKWTFAECDGVFLTEWALEQNLRVLRDIYSLFEGISSKVIRDIGVNKRSVKVLQGSAANMNSIVDGSITNICMDPPYFDNVMYAELADFFYVWEKRTLGLVRPDFFPDSLSDKDDEAVANPSRFEYSGKRKNELAELDYQSKMTAIFKECRRVLAPEGVMSVMFTHKRAEAWDSLGTGLLEAGFTIETSWPVNTEAEHSLHQAKMNSAASTIMLVCRKKEVAQGSTKTFLEDIANEVRTAARDAVQRFENDGISGVDLLLSTYGPTLSVISKYWPVYSSTPDESGKDRYLRPEEALNIAREELVALRQKRLVGHAAKLDSLTDFVVIAWDTFKAREFAFDTARLLALAVGGLDIDFLVRQKIVEKSAGKVRLLSPIERLRRDSDADLAGVRIEASSFHYMVDAIDTMLFIAQEDGMAAAKRFLDKTGLISNDIFRDAVQATVNAIPRTQIKNEWVVQEAGLLDTLVTAYFPEISLPSLLEIQAKQEIPTLFDSPEDSIVISE